MTKITLRTSIVKLPGRKREPDSDHAVMILDHLRRGYSVNARSDDDMYSVSYSRLAGPVFVNQPEGTSDVIREFINYGADNAALYDETPPEWVAKLTRLVANITPPGMYISRNMNLNGDTNHG